MTQIEFYLPPPITAHEAASIIGRLGGQARARKLREPIISTTKQLRRECGLGEHRGLA